MAKLGSPYPFPQLKFSGNDFHTAIEAQEKALAEIPIDKLISFPVADGQAHYFVKSLEPLVLQWINYLDGYMIPDAYIRGLRKEDVKRMIRSNKAFAELWIKKGE